MSLASARPLVNDLSLLSQRLITHTRFDRVRLGSINLNSSTGVSLGVGKCSAVVLKLNLASYNVSPLTLNQIFAFYIGDERQQTYPVMRQAQDTPQVLFCNDLSEIRIRYAADISGAGAPYPMAEIMIYESDIDLTDLSADEKVNLWLSRQFCATQFATIRIPTSDTIGKPLGQGRCAAVVIQQPNGVLNNVLAPNGTNQCYIGDADNQTWVLTPNSAYPSPVIFCRDLSEVYIRTPIAQNAPNAYPFVNVIVYHNQETVNSPLTFYDAI